MPKNVEISEFEVKLTVASKLYEFGRLSSGQAAEIADLS
ncbi:MAG: UPF0175 family protein [Pyrinomonadaceae bacterium]|nr:UPF0175 family protein [Pyrinomonadaceae bacterium]